MGVLALHSLALLWLAGDGRMGEPGQRSDPALGTTGVDALRGAWGLGHSTQSCHAGPRVHSAYGPAVVTQPGLTRAAARASQVGGDHLGTCPI